MARRYRIQTAIIGAWLAASFSAAASGQSFLNPDPKAPYQPWIDAASFNQVIAEMEIDDDLRSILLAVRADLAAFYAVQGAAAEKRINEARERILADRRKHREDPSYDNSDDFDHTEHWAEWHLTRQAREDQFRSDIAAALPATAREQWRTFMQDATRERTTFDINHFLQHRRPLPILHEIVAETDRGDEIAAAIGAALDEHVDELDRWLGRWEREYVEGQLKYHILYGRMRQGQISEERLSRESYNVSQVVLDLRTWVLEDAARLAPLLPDDLRREFERAVAEVAEPSIYHRSPVEEVFDQLRASRRVDDARHRALDGIKAEYESRLAPMRRRMVAANEQWHDPENKAERWQRHQAMRAEDPPRDPGVIDGEHPILDILPVRRQLEFDTLRAIGHLFTPDELATLPRGVRFLLAFGER